MKQIFKNAIARNLLLIPVALLLVSLNVANAHSATPTLSALDTVAGFETVLTAAELKPHQQATIKVTTPSSELHTFLRTADDEGRIELTISEAQTKSAGIYQVALLQHNLVSRFEVFPGEMDSIRSSLFTNQQEIIADGTSHVTGTVRIVDEYLNPLASHEVKLTSNRPHDSITPSSVITDTHGNANFFVNSTRQGFSNIRAFDETAARSVEKNVSITFFNGVSVKKEIGGDPQLMLLALASPSTSTSSSSQSPAVTRFEIENLPASIATAVATNVRIKAVDANGATVSSFDGTVVFSSTDTNATLPNKYIFTPTDQGNKTFDLGVSFRTIGTQKLMVALDGSAAIKGERSIEVTASQGTSEASSGAIRITKPAQGTYSVSTLEIAGEATPNARVSIYHNGQQIGQVQATNTGRFTYNTSLLKDGSHTFYVESSGVQSASVPVTIDTTPARVEEVTLSKTKVAPGESVNLSIRSDPDLASIQATLGELIADLKADKQNPGQYTAILSAPAVPGEYTVNVIITDKIGNPSPAVEVGKVTVQESLGSSTVGTFAVPTKVKNVKATPGNARVTLMWDPADSEASIAHYRIYYGTDSRRLTGVAMTKDFATKWSVTNLQNGTPYFFQVVGVDTRGVEGDHRSDAVKVSPSETADDSAVFTGTLVDAAGGQLRFSGQATDYIPSLCVPGPCPRSAAPPPKTPDDGPAIWWMIPVAVAGAQIWKRFAILS